MLALRVPTIQNDDNLSFTCISKTGNLLPKVIEAVLKLAEQSYLPALNIKERNCELAGNRVVTAYSAFLLWSKVGLPFASS